MPYQHRKVTTRFTQAEFNLLAFAASKLTIKGREATVSKFIRQAVREEIKKMGITEEQMKASDTGPAPSRNTPSRTIKR